MVTSVIPPSHHRKAKIAKRRSNYFLMHKSQLQYKLRGLINDCYYVTLPSPGVPNILTRGPNSRLPDHWRTAYSAICMIYAK